MVQVEQWLFSDDMSGCYYEISYLSFTHANPTVNQSSYYKSHHFNPNNKKITQKYYNVTDFECFVQVPNSEIIEFLYLSVNAALNVTHLNLRERKHK